MKYVFLVWALCVLGACTTQPDGTSVQEGTWSGGLTPMNHPDLTTPLTFDVVVDDGQLGITIGGPGGILVDTREAVLDGDTLRFVFNEPEMDVLLTCALGSDGSDTFAGRCADADGKWATVTMTAPI